MPNDIITKPHNLFAALASVVVTVHGQRRQRPRGGRQEPDAGYGAPQAQYGQPQADASSLSESQHGDHQGLDWLLESVPGTPGEDYPILAEVPETGFTCDGQVEGGYYGDPDTECQAFHVCTSDGQGGLAKYSFLCPNGTIFNQGYFICDWWFNFDCAETEGLYSLNDEVAAEREAASAAQAGAASAPQASYSEPGSEPLADYGREGRQGRRQGRRQG